VRKTCNVCGHPHRRTIDNRLRAGTPLGDLATCFGTSVSDLQRHKEAHLPEALAARAQQPHDLARADGVLEEVRGLYRETQDMLAQAKEAGDVRTALHAVETAGRLLTLQAKLLDQIEAEAQAPTHTEGEPGYICWVREDGEYLGITLEPPFIADGDQREYLGALSRLMVFKKALDDGRVLEIKLPFSLAQKVSAAPPEVLPSEPSRPDAPSSSPSVTGGQEGDPR